MAAKGAGGRGLRRGLAALALALVASAGWGATASCSQLRVAGAGQWVPFAYGDGRGRARGVAVALVRRIARELALPVSVRVNLPWARMELMLMQGQLDLLAGNYATPERRENWLLTDAFAYDEVRVFVRADAAFAFDQLSDLRLRRGVVPLGISLGQAFDSYAEHLRLTRVNSHQQMFRMLIQGRVDYLVLPLTSGLYRTQDMALDAQVVPLPKAIHRNTVHLAFSRQSPCAALLPQVNALLQQLQRNGELKALMQREMDRL